MSAVLGITGQLYAPSSSAAGVVSFLQEEDEQLKVRALEKLYRVIDVHWAEVCNSLDVIEALSEDAQFPGHELAAAIASKCFYHLQVYDDALRLALFAGPYFDISLKSEYTDTLITRCIDEYTVLRKAQNADPAAASPIDPRMESIVEQMFERCYRDGCFEQAVGVALDTLRIDRVEEVCVRALAAGRASILAYTFDLCQGARSITLREFRLAVIAVLVRIYSTLPEPDYANVCFGYQYLNRPIEVAATLDQLCRGSLTHALQAFQIAFDLQETENQGFVLQVVAALPAPTPLSEDALPEAAEAAAAYAVNAAKLRRILVESFDVDLTLNFLFKQAYTDTSTLLFIKSSTEGRTSILHNATVVAHSYMNAGTTRDSFLRDNLEWLGKASNWNKFTAVASIGVVHKGHVHESMNLLAPYLPQGGVSSSPYSEAGALYALGLIHANKGGAGDSTTISYLSEALRNTGTNTVVQHGACLGIGLAALATANEPLFNELKNLLYTDNAIAGEGAALSLGLLLLGQSESPLAQTAIPDLLNYAHDTTHEKIIRALALAIAMMVYGKEESADALIEQLSRDRDPIIRYGAMFAVAMAYCGTSDNGAVRRLLHVAVSDVNDDVRRAAVTCLGFVMFRAPETVPKLVALLAESFNPHVRYGACMAVGISCAGSALKEAIDLLTGMLEDAVDFVRQGAYMCLALVLMQASEARSPSVKKLREHLRVVIADKHQPVMAKNGAILATGILEAGGRNVVVSLMSRRGLMKLGGAVGVMMWLQHWYWYPLMHFLALSFSPTMLIGLNKDFDLPVHFSVKCNAPPSMFANPRVEDKKEEDKKTVATAVLSTTVRAKARIARKESRKTNKTSTAASAGGSVSGAEAGDGNAMERVLSYVSATSQLSAEETVAEVKESDANKPKKEPSSFVLSNPARVIPSQVRFIALQADQRYTPVSRRTEPIGILMLVDNDPTSAEEISKVERVSIGQGDEAEAFEPFEWDPNET